MSEAIHRPVREFVRWRAASRIGWVASLWVALGHAPAVGQPTSLASYGVAQLDYAAPSECPARAAFVRRVAARLKHADSDDVQPAWRVDVRLQSREREVMGTLAVHVSGRAPRTRRLRAASCADVADGLALVLTLMLQRRAEPAATDAPSGDEASGQPAPAESPGDARPPPREPTQTSTLQPTPATAEPISASEAVRTWHLAAYGSAGAVTGVLPRAKPSFQLSATFSVFFSKAVAFALRAGFRGAPSHELRHPEGVARFQWWSAMVGLCAGARIGAAPARVFGCLAQEVGRLSASGRRTRNPRQSHELWTAGGPAAVVEWAALSRLSIQLGVEALWPWTRRRYLLADDTVHRPASPGFRIHLGVGVALL